MRGCAVVLLIGLLFESCYRSTAERASYQVPDSDVCVVVQRTSAHSFLGEYVRSVHLDVAGESVSQHDLLLDTGGYSRTNLYRLGPTLFVLRDADASYLIDIVSRTLSQDDQRRKPETFVGSFDVDSSNVWRFIPSSSRPELPTEFAGG